MISVDASLQNIGYGLAGTVYLVLAILLLTSFRGRLRGGLLAVAALVSAAWAFFMSWGAQAASVTAVHLFVAEMLHDAIWIVFLSALLAGAVGARQLLVMRYGGTVLIAVLTVVGIGREIYARYDAEVPDSSGVLVMGSILTSLYVLVLIEQIYRNARESQRRGLKYLCLGVGGIFAYDLFLYSNAVLAGQVSELLWGARGFAVALCIPLIAVAAQRSPSWSVGIFVSRQIVFYTATLFGAGVYLTIVGMLGYYIRLVGGDWGPAAQVIFFFAAIIALSVFLFSDQFRLRSRVFISKHFYQNKFDYREEWLRLIDTLTSIEEALPLKKRAIKALAQIVDAPSGLLWLVSTDGKEYQSSSNWNTSEYLGSFDINDSLPEFMRRTEWIIEINEYLADSSHYASLDFDAAALGLEQPALVIPLFNDADMLGFVVLAEPASGLQLNYEDRDLLKTAGKQVASHLAQDQATEQLAQGRQFEALNKLTAYIMHDLKNIIAQQSLVVENAQEHKGNPKFIEDAIETIKGGVARMRRVIEQLQQRSAVHNFERVELGSLIMRAVSQCADREPVPNIHIVDERVLVRADPERLQMAIYHAIRNAQEATAADGKVSVDLEIEENICRIIVKDTGCGMNQAFVRERLFKPFDSTKGTQGMGIGAYQIRETLRAVDGNIEVDSEVGSGTTVILSLPSDAAVTKQRKSTKEKV